MRFAIILLYGFTLFLFTGCEADEVETSQNQTNDSNAPSMVDEMPRDEAQGEADDTADTDQMQTSNDGGEDTDDMNDGPIAEPDMRDGEMSGGDSETTVAGETIDATEVAEMLDAVCVEECELYAECNPDDPDGDADLCIEFYCVYAESLAEEPEVENEYYACLSADLTFYQCLANLECSEFNRFYDEETADADIPCATAYEAFVAACEQFYEDAEDIQ